MNIAGHRRRPARSSWAAVLVGGLLISSALAGCGGNGAGGDPATGQDTTTVSLYTSYSQPEVDAVLAAYETAAPTVTVELFRAPTGQLNARIAAEQRSGGIQGDVLLLSDPLSMQQFDAQGVLRKWDPPEAQVVPADARTDTFWGVTTSNVVVVHKPGKSPASWADLAGADYRDGVAVPDPGFAGSAFGALGYFSLADGYGVDFYQRLKANGAVQVQAPGDVVAGVAEGRFSAGMTLDFLARAAIAKGSPIEVSAPEPGAVRLYAPVAVFEATDDAQAAEAFANFLLTVPAQQALADLDRHPIRSDVPAKEAQVKEVVPDWPLIFQRQGELLADYRNVFGG